METSDTNELLSAYKKYTCIKKPHDYKKIKKGVHLKTFYLDSISKNEDSLSKTDKLEFLDYLEKLIHQYKDILNRGTVRLPTISKILVQKMPEISRNFLTYLLLQKKTLE